MSNGTKYNFNYQDYVNAIDSGKEFKLYICYNGNQFDPDRIELDGLYMQDGITLTDIANGDGNYALGNTSMAQVEMTFIKELMPQELESKKPFYLFATVDLPSPSDCIFIGKFIPTAIQPRSNNRLVTVTAHDEMSLFNVPANKFIKTYISNNITKYDPDKILTSYILFQLLCDYVGVVPGLFGLNQDKFRLRVITDSMLKELENSTCRQILAYLAEGLADRAYIDPLTISQSGDFSCRVEVYGGASESIINRDKIFAEDIPAFYKPMLWEDFETYTWDEADKLSWEKVEGTTSTYAAAHVLYLENNNNNISTERYPDYIGGKDYNLTSNPFLVVNTQQDVLDYIKPIFSAMSHEGYPSISVSVKGYWWLRAGDLATVYTEDGSRVQYRIYRLTTTWKGGITTETYEVSGSIGIEYGSGTNESSGANAYDPRVSGLVQEVDDLNADLETLNDKVSAIGTLLVGTSASSLVVSTGAYKTVCSVDITPGTWVIMGGGGFNAAYAGTIYLRLLRGSTQLTVVFGTSESNGGNLNIGYILNTTSNQTINLAMYQNSGSNKTATNVFLRAVKIA